MTLKLIGKKKGMTRVFDEAGNVIVCTVIQVEPNIIAQIKTKERDGYRALQLASQKLTASKAKKYNKPLLGHFSKNGIEPRRYLLESKREDVEQFKIGQEIDASYFADYPFVDVSSFSKGKGYQGVIKRYGFAGGPASHGSGFHRHGGSCGMRTSPGRCLPGVKKAGRMGYDRVTVQNLKLVKADPAKSVLLVKGAVPGPIDGVVHISPAKKKMVLKKKAA